MCGFNRGLIFHIKWLQLKSKKIYFNYYDSHGMKPLLKSIALKQTKFALKLIEVFSKNYSNTNELANQICKNSLVHLNENIIQLCIRHDQFLVFNKIVDLMCSSEAKSANLFNMLKHKNVYFQNILHVFASLDKNLKGHFLNGNFLNEFAQKISAHFSYRIFLYSRIERMFCCIWRRAATKLAEIRCICACWIAIKIVCTSI